MVAAQGKAEATREQAEASMVLTGNIDISPSGQVEGFSLRDEDRLESYIVGFLRDNVAQWRFEPVLHDGQPIAARTPVSSRLLASRTPDGDTHVILKSANFRAYDPDETDSVGKLRMPPPPYPEEAVAGRRPAIGTDG